MGTDSNCYVHLQSFPRQTRAGILDAQSGSRAYLGVQNHTPLDRDRRTKIHRKMTYHSRRKENKRKRMTRGRHPNAKDGLRKTETQVLQPGGNKDTSSKRTASPHESPLSCNLQRKFREEDEDALVAVDANWPE